MGRLERKIRKRLTQETQPFEAWCEAHKDRLSRFEQPQESDLGQVKAKRRSPAFVWLACALALLFVALAVTLGLLLNNRSQQSIPDLSFGETSVYSVAMSEDVYEESINLIPTLSNLTETVITQIMRTDDNSLVMSTFQGALETNSNYYFIGVRLVFNEYFVLSDKDMYNDLEYQTMIGETPVSYGVRGQDDYGFDQYRVVSEHGDVTAYWTVSSINGEFEEWLQLTFAA